MTNPKIDKYGNKSWCNNQGQLHREDGPAFEWANGNKEWWLNNRRHREDGPAIEKVNGTKAWFLNNQLHREDGPAIEWADGDKEWWLNDRQIRPFKPVKIKQSPTFELLKAVMK